jgi:type IV secretory pathway VirD2 relaxase
MLMYEHKQENMGVALLFLEHCHRESDKFLDHTVKEDNTWVSHYEQPTPPPPKKRKFNGPTQKITASMFLNR